MLKDEAGDAEPHAVSGPLANVRVLDLSRLVPGAVCSQILADLGADVIKIEEPVHGDYMRQYGPRVNASDVGYAYALLNRNKRSVCIDLRSARGGAVMRRLIRTSDVLLESFRPGVMDRLHLGFEQAKVERSDIVYCSLSGYGAQSSVVAPAHDINLLGLAGQLSGDHPAVPLVPQTDLETGQRAALAICAALLGRMSGHGGRHLDIAMLDGAVTWMVLALADHFATGEEPGPSDEVQDRALPRMIGRVPGYGTYQTLDRRHIALGALEGKFWRALCDAIGRPDLADSKLAAVEIDEQLRAAFRSRTRDTWIASLSEAGVPVTPVNTLTESVRDPAVVDRHLLPTVEDPALGRYSIVRTGLGFDEVSVYRLPPPTLGANTDEVLTSAGFTSLELEELRKEGAID